VLVTHAATKIALCRALLDDPKAEVRCGICSISKFVREEDNWKRVLNGYARHLSCGEVMHWEFPEEYKERKKLEKKS